MSLEILEYQAFTLNGSGGNRASVVFGLDIESTKKMQSIAASTGSPATVFVGISQGLFRDEAPMPMRLRFFTPEIEENICGHGTIAALEAMRSRGGLNGWSIPEDSFQIELPLGFQNAKFERGLAWLEYPKPFAQNLEEDLPNQNWNHVLELRAEFALSLGLELDDLHEDLPVMLAGVGRPKLVCAVPSTIYLDAIEPNLERIADLCDTTKATGIVAFTFPGRAGCFTDTRHFSFQGNHVLEDAATGNAHVALAAYLTANQFFDDGARDFSGAQGYACGSPSRLEVRMNVSGGDVSQVWIGGKAREVRDTRGPA
jgi:trans-2,3-dihydro-3-hydroxyanthranilate isomerase